MKYLSRIASFALILTGAAVMASAQSTAPAPEIDPAMGANALALLAGAAILIRARRGK
jgi:hypothetical protein